MIFANADAGPYRVVHSPASPETASMVSRWQPLRRPVVLDVAAEWVPQTWRELSEVLG